jgi:hypothetical protein
MQQLNRPTAALVFIWIWAYRLNFLASLHRPPWQDPSSSCTFFFTQVSFNVRNRPTTVINEPNDERHLGRKTKRQHQILFDSCRKNAMPLNVLGIHLAGNREKSGTLQPYTNQTLVFSYLPPVEFDTRSSTNRQSQVSGNASPRHNIKLWQELRVSPTILLREERLLETLCRLPSPLISHPTGPVSIPLYPETYRHPTYKTPFPLLWHAYCMSRVLAPRCTTRRPSTTVQRSSGATKHSPLKCVERQ